MPPVSTGELDSDVTALLSESIDAGGASLRGPVHGTAHKALLKGRQTRATILEAALRLAAQTGLEGLSIGALAEVTAMSKSGVFAHFGSREELQISVIRAYHAKFEEEVFVPALRAPRGLPRLAAMFDRWVERVAVEIDSGCIYIGGAVELDDRPGPVRDALVGMVQTWRRALERSIQAAVAEGHLRPGTDRQQLLFEVHGMILALHHDARFLRNPGADLRARSAFKRLIESHSSITARVKRGAATPARPASQATGQAVDRKQAVRSAARSTGPEDRAATRKPPHFPK